VSHAGRSGVTYPFVWNAKYAKHVYLGREVTPKEFNKVARDIFTAPKPRLHPVPEIYVDPYGRDEDPEVVTQVETPKPAIEVSEKKSPRAKKEAPAEVEEDMKF